MNLDSVKTYLKGVASNFVAKTFSGKTLAISVAVAFVLGFIIG